MVNYNTKEENCFKQKLVSHHFICLGNRKKQGYKFIPFQKGNNSNGLAFSRWSITNKDISIELRQLGNTQLYIYNLVFSLEQHIGIKLQKLEQHSHNTNQSIKYASILKNIPLYSGPILKFLMVKQTLYIASHGKQPSKSTRKRDFKYLYILVKS